MPDSLLDGLGAVGAAGGVFADGVVFVGAEAVVAGFADGLGYGRDLEGGDHVLVIDGDLGAVGDGEGVAGLLAAGEVGRDELGGLSGGRAGLGVAAELGDGAGEADGGIGGVVLELGLGDGADGLGGGGLVGALADLEELGDGEGHEDEHDGHDDEELDQREASLSGSDGTAAAWKCEGDGLQVGQVCID